MEGFRAAGGSGEELKAAACGCSCSGPSAEPRNHFCLSAERCCPTGLRHRSPADEMNADCEGQPIQNPRSQAAVGTKSNGSALADFFLKSLPRGSLAAHAGGAWCEHPGRAGGVLPALPRGRGAQTSLCSTAWGQGLLAQLLFVLLVASTSLACLGDVCNHFVIPCHRSARNTGFQTKSRWL